MTLSTSIITLSSRVTIPEEVLFQELAGEAVILDLASECYFGLDGVGTRFWELIQRDPSVQAAFDVLLGEYEVEAPQLQGDLLALLESLLEAGLVRVE